MKSEAEYQAWPAVSSISTAIVWYLMRSPTEPISFLSAPVRKISASPTQRAGCGLRQVNRLDPPGLRGLPRPRRGHLHHAGRPGPVCGGVSYGRVYQLPKGSLSYL
jgi:hypothetical protein